MQWNVFLVPAESHALRRVLLAKHQHRQNLAAATQQHADETDPASDTAVEKRMV
jgi:hypothetical protein